ncbi:hypothetical protein IFM89_022807 [Coptis chinensis]|uniref:Splicing factor SF3a60 /Prp9 subunit C-terminal domain-containing protein n=1 Tax=Coptis chinensis TaxID=261450 RepID=A0A835I6F1_9MAGN|nr:hypothetical protein IFM89_022807 [Coptis chinensis]
MQSLLFCALATTYMTSVKPIPSNIAIAITFEWGNNFGQGYMASMEEVQGRQRKVMTMSSRSTILSSCQWAGMGNPFHTSYTSFMVLARLLQMNSVFCPVNSNVRYVGTTPSGRRAFERHFKEWRHQRWNRCLGIPNTKNFNEVTSIEVLVPQVPAK